jgi:hypothetical protein
MHACTNAPHMRLLRASTSALSIVLQIGLLGRQIQKYHPATAPTIANYIGRPNILFDTPTWASHIGTDVGAPYTAGRGGHIGL